MSSQFNDLPQVMRDKFQRATQRYVELKEKFNSPTDAFSKTSALDVNILTLELNAAQNDVNRVFQECLEELGKIHD